MHLDFGGLESRGSSGQVAADAQRACGLERNAAAPGRCFQSQMPAPLAHLFHTAGNIYEGKRLLVVAFLEVHPAVIKINPLQAIARGDRRWRAIGSALCVALRLRRRQPALEVPAVFGVSHQNQTGMTKRERAQLKSAVKKSRPAEAGAQSLGA